MAELTSETGLLNYIDNTKHVFENVKSTDKVEFSFPWKAPVTAIEYIESGCPVCTKAWYDFEKNAIVGVLDLSRANGNNHYLKGTTAVDKDIMVWINDGQQRFVPNDKLQKTTNQLKPFIRIKISGTVLV